MASYLNLNYQLKKQVTRGNYLNGMDTIDRVICEQNVNNSK
ncbi:hypothetical protein [Salipaludibacillus sp. CF4.18]